MAREETYDVGLRQQTVAALDDATGLELLVLLVLVGHGDEDVVGYRVEGLDGLLDRIGAVEAGHAFGGVLEEEIADRLRGTFGGPLDDRFARCDVLGLIDCALAAIIE